MYKDIQQRQHFCDNGDLETNYIPTSKKKKKRIILNVGYVLHSTIQKQHMRSVIITWTDLEISVDQKKTR